MTINQGELFVPYKELEPYTEDDRDYFFGREQDQETIAANLVTAPLTILFGMSGVGKTSVLQAGVVPFLRQKPDVIVVTFNAWQERTFVDLFKDRVTRAVNERTNQSFSSDDSPLDQFLARAAQESQCTLAIIFDQFEDYLLYQPESKEETSFDAEFASAVNREDIEVNFLLSVREDCLSRLDRFQGRIPILFDNYLRIDYLNRDTARTAIEKPIERYNELLGPSMRPVRIEPELVEVILDQVRRREVSFGETKRDIADTRIETSYLQKVITRLWNEEMRAGSRVLQLKTLRRLGDADHIMRAHLYKAMNLLPQFEQNIVSQIFFLLVTPSGRMIPHTVYDLAKYANRPDKQVYSLLEKLSGREFRIVRSVASPPGQPSEQRYEIFHYALVPAIMDWRERYVQPMQRGSGSGMWQPLSLILFLVLSLRLVKSGLLDEFNTPIEYASLLLGVSILSSIGYIVLRLRVWIEDSLATLPALAASLQSGLIPVRVLLFSSASFIRIVTVVITVVVTTLEFYDRHDLVIQAQDFIITKIGRLVNALLH